MLRDKLHKRGIIVAVTVLGGLLGQNAAQAAPAAVMAELGKMAMVGGAVASAGAGSAAAGAGAGTATSAVGAGILAGVKAKVITAAAVAVVGVTSVVTYNALKSEPARPVRTVRAAVVSDDRPTGPTTAAPASPQTVTSNGPVAQAEVQQVDVHADSAAIPDDDEPVGGPSMPEDVPAGEIDQAKWSEGKAIMGSLATAIRAYYAEHGQIPPDNSIQALGFIADDLRGNYFNAAMFEFKVSSAQPLRYVITATNENLRPARMILDQDGRSQAIE